MDALVCLANTHVPENVNSMLYSCICLCYLMLVLYCRCTTVNFDLYIILCCTECITGMCLMCNINCVSHTLHCLSSNCLYPVHYHLWMSLYQGVLSKLDLQTLKLISQANACHVHILTCCRLFMQVALSQVKHDDVTSVPCSLMHG